MAKYKKNDLCCIEQSSTLTQQNYFKKFIIFPHTRKLMLSGKIGNCGYMQDTTNIFL